MAFRSLLLCAFVSYVAITTASPIESPLPENNKVEVENVDPSSQNNKLMGLQETSLDNQIGDQESEEHPETAGFRSPVKLFKNTGRKIRNFSNSVSNRGRAFLGIQKKPSGRDRHPPRRLSNFVSDVAHRQKPKPRWNRDHRDQHQGKPKDTHDNRKPNIRKPNNGNHNNGHHNNGNHNNGNHNNGHHNNGNHNNGRHNNDNNKTHNNGKYNNRRHDNGKHNSGGKSRSTTDNGENFFVGLGKKTAETVVSTLPEVMQVGLNFANNKLIDDARRQIEQAENYKFDKYNDDEDDFDTEDDDGSEGYTENGDDESEDDTQNDSNESEDDTQNDSDESKDDTQNDSDENEDDSQNDSDESEDDTEKYDNTAEDNNDNNNNDKSTK